VEASGDAVVFPELATAVAQALGTTAEVAGYLLGLFLIILVIIVVAWAIGKSENLLVVVGLAGVAFDVLIGWWPLWTVVLLVIGLATILFRLSNLGSSSTE